MAHNRYVVLYLRAVEISCKIANFYHVLFSDTWAHAGATHIAYSDSTDSYHDVHVSLCSDMGEGSEKIPKPKQRDRRAKKLHSRESIGESLMPLSNSNEHFEDRVLAALENLDRRIELIQDKLTATVVEVAVMKAKIAFFSALGGIIAGSAASVIVSFISKR